MATITDLDKSSSTAHLSITSALPECRDADRSADSPSPPVTSTGGQDCKTSPSSPDNSSTQSAEYWASLIRQSFSALYNGGALEAECLKAPRRRHADQNSASLAHRVAGLLYPSYSDSNIPQVIKYEKDIVFLRKAIQARQKADEMAKAEARHHSEWKKRILGQGPWDEVKDPLPLTGAPALPMPVTISDEESLAAFFNHLSVGGTHDTLNGTKGFEPYYGVDVAEFEKGILYEDGRMDLCKMVLGPLNISQLMTSLDGNTFVRHFLLGNNMIGPVGARRISEFVLAHPDRIETWYLAGNCIDLAGFERLVFAWTTSSSITNIWLKRNPLGPKSSTALYDLITKTSKLRTLDLDQTELGDEGVAQLFSLLANYHNATSLRHVYLNAVGIGQSACTSLANYLSSPHCMLESVYLSANPMGDVGAIVLAEGLASNKSLIRLTQSSCGLKSEGAKSILRALKGHPQLMTLHMGQSFATEDLGMRYNYLEDDVVDSVKGLVLKCKTLRMLELGTTGMTLSALESIAQEVIKSETLVVFSAKSVYDKVSIKVKLPVNQRIEENIRQLYRGIDFARFVAEEKRWLISPKDVRLIDSAYRNRDAGLARRGHLVLNKVWQDGMETVNGVMSADDSHLAAEMEG